MARALGLFVTAMDADERGLGRGSPKPDCPKLGGAGGDA